jgi:trehalose 6-phosphate phosphatase
VKGNIKREALYMMAADLRTVLTRRPVGLVFDIDGTLSPIAPTPAEAHLYPGVASLLELARQYAHVAIITGRTVEDGAALVNVEGLTYIGIHGLEWCDGLPGSHPVQLLPEALPYVKPGKYLLDLAQQQLSKLPGILVERKRVGGAIHYRLSENPEQARERILALLTEPAQQVNMRLSEGKRVVEVKTPLAADKGQALRRFVQRFGLQGVCFAGDDRTDLDAVREIPQLRQDGRAAIAVVVQHADTLPALLEHADIVVHEVEGMVKLLGEMVEFLRLDEG